MIATTSHDCTPNDAVQPDTSDDALTQRYARLDDHSLLCRDCSTRTHVVAIPGDEWPLHNDWHSLTPAGLAGLERLIREGRTFAESVRHIVHGKPAMFHDDDASRVIGWTSRSDDVLHDYPNARVQHRPECDHVSAADACIGGCPMFND